MAKFRCRACGPKGEFEYDGDRHGCPLCGSSDVVFALAIEELPDGLLEQLLALPPGGGGPKED